VFTLVKADKNFLQTEYINWMCDKYSTKLLWETHFRDFHLKTEKIRRSFKTNVLSTRIVF